MAKTKLINLKSKHTSKALLNQAQALLDVGFKDLAQWKIESDQRLQDFGDNENAWAEVKNAGAALYAFCFQQTVLYIGKATNNLQQRFNGYRKPGNTRATNQKCHFEIRRLLEAGKIVRILVFLDTTNLYWGSFRINLAAGLEDSLVAKLSPALNGVGIKNMR
jgi:hypothetical protein